MPETPGKRPQAGLRKPVMRALRPLLVAILFGSSFACGGDDGSSASPGATAEPAVGTVELFVELDAPSEGLVFGVDPKGAPALYLGGANAIRRATPTKELEKIADVPSPLGMALLADGAIVVCGRAPGDAGSGKHPGALWRVTPSGEATVLTAGTADLPLDQPNMVAVSPSGDLVFSDSKAHRVFRVGADGAGLAVVTDAIHYPNGLAFSADGTKLLVASYDGNKVYSLSRDASGGLGAPEVFVEAANVDGITPLASGGFVFVQTGKGVVTVTPDGKMSDGTPEIVKELPSNGAFGVGAFGEKWIYVSNVFGRPVHRVYLGQTGAKLPPGK